MTINSYINYSRFGLVKFKVLKIFGSMFLYNQSSIQLPGHFPGGVYNLTIEGKSSDNYRFKNFTSDIYYKKNTNRVDKPIYHPSDKVMIRIIV